MIEHHDTPETSPSGGVRTAPMEEIRNAREKLSSSPLSPNAGILCFLSRHDGGPILAGRTLVTDFEIERGRPQHGALRSDDHVSNYEAVVPFEDADDDDIPDECPECGHDRLQYVYSAYHHIAGSYGAECAYCGTEIVSEEWS